jgi:predicted component of type VI protein secretion system
MKLSLTVIASQSANAPCGTSRTIEGDQIIIGRGAGCDWILPDPLNHLSKRHCAIAATATGYVITDTSTNGVFVNDAGDALGNGATVVVHDGDRLTLGDYVLEARIVENQPEAQRAMAAEDDDDPFGIGDIMVQRAPLSSSAAPSARTPGFAPFGAEPPPEPATPFASGASDFSRSGLIPEDISWLNETTPEERASPAPSPIDSGLASSDHLAGHHAAFVPPRVEGAAIPDKWWDDDRAEPRSAAPSKPVTPVREPDGGVFDRSSHLAGTSEIRLTLLVVASRSPEISLGTSRTIANEQIVIGRGPDCDWTLPDPHNHLSKRHCVITANVDGYIVTDTSTNGVFVNGAGTALGDGRTIALNDGDRLTLGEYVIEAHVGEIRPEPELAAASQHFPALHPLDGASEAARIESGGIPDDWLNDAPSAARAAALPSAPLRSAALAAAPRAAMPPSGDLIVAFLSGAELPHDALESQDGAAVLRAAGRAYRAAILGMAEILRTRALIKSEFRIERTRIGAVGNNPLKFLENGDEIMAAMVGAATPGFQEAGVALRDGIRDLKAHQLAMVAAIQVALERLLAQLDPEMLKSRLEKRSLLSAVLPGARKARYWEVFEESYKAIAAELEEDFNGVFGKAFAEAYEDELRRP